MQRIVICDDSPGVLVSLTRMVDELWTVPHETVGLFSWEALERYLLVEAPGQVDILMMDIKLGQQNGIDLSQKLLLRWPRIKVIFITGYIEYCEEIFQTSPTAFLVKPIKPEKLLFALEKANRELEEEAGQYLIILDRMRSSVRIPIQQIAYAESEGRLARIRAEERTVECYLRLDELEQQLTRQFIRCHQSYLVNLEYVELQEKSKLLLRSGERIPISRARSKETRERLMEFARKSL